MKNKDANTKRRRRALPIALLGVLLGAGLAYALVQWRRALMPELQLQPTADGVSIYEVSGDVTRDWPAGSADAVGNHGPTGSAAAPVTGSAAADADDTGAGLWGDIPAGIVLPNAGDAGMGNETMDDEPDRAPRAGLEEIEGIGPVYAKALTGLGLVSTDDLLQAGADPKGRETLAGATGISEKLILRWVNQADLFRVKGVGEQYADLLEAAGVDTVPELAQRRADSLTKKMVEVNERKKLVRRVPTEAQVAGWIEHAKSLRRVVTY